MLFYLKKILFIFILPAVYNPHYINNIYGKNESMGQYGFKYVGFCGQFKILLPRQVFCMAFVNGASGVCENN